MGVLTQAMMQRAGANVSQVVIHAPSAWMLHPTCTICTVLLNKVVLRWSFYFAYCDDRLQCLSRSYVDADQQNSISTLLLLLPIVVCNAPWLQEFQARSIDVMVQSQLTIVQEVSEGLQTHNPFIA